MQQRVALRHDGPGGRLGIVMEQSFRALGKEELLALGDIHDVYLLEELQSRGYQVEYPPLATTTTEAGTGKGSISHPVAMGWLYSVLASNPGLRLGTMMAEFFRYALERGHREGLNQKQLARLLGVSSRALCYRNKKVKEGTRGRGNMVFGPEEDPRAGRPRGRRRIADGSNGGKGRATELGSTRPRQED